MFNNINLGKLINSETGKILISILLGLGLATLFRKICRDKNCLEFRGVPIEEIQGKTYEFNGKCYRYTPKHTKCADKDNENELINVINV